MPEWVGVKCVKGAPAAVTSTPGAVDVTARPMKGRNAMPAKRHAVTRWTSDFSPPGHPRFTNPSRPDSLPKSSVSSLFWPRILFSLNPTPYTVLKSCAPNRRSFTNYYHPSSAPHLHQRSRSPIIAEPKQRHTAQSIQYCTLRTLLSPGGYSLTWIKELEK